MYISSPSMQPQEGKKWTTFTPPAPTIWRRYRGLILHRRSHAPAIRAAADAGGQDLDLREFELAVLTVIAYPQPTTLAGLKDIFGRDTSRDLMGRLQGRDLIATGPRAPRRGAPYTFVTTETFLAAFNMETLRDLPDAEQLADAGIPS
ncbi:SMC-Scp complex subunit ScpB [Thioalkalivibrio sp.]|uniref:SMC-Scp complex subunit ScpB n=1 Tax=Thioalkalivibrio sp. TaxID=2093813 RepID=UPI003975407D